MTEPNTNITITIQRQIVEEKMYVKKWFMFKVYLCIMESLFTGL